MKLLAIVLLLPLAFCESKSLEPFVIEQTSLASRGLQEDLQDFANLIPTTDIIGLVLTYVITDPEVKTIYQYVSRSEEFRELYRRAMDTPEVHDLVALLESYNLPVVGVINEIAFLLALPQYVPRQAADFSYVKAPTNGISGLVDSVLRLLPREKLIRLYIQKLATSPEFRQLNKDLSSEKTAEAVIRVAINPEVGRAYREVEKRGVNLVQIAKQVVVYFLDL